MGNNNELKMVKNAKLFSSDKMITIEHYDTLIFTYHEDTKKASCLLHCSQTSDRMIRRAIQFFNVEDSKLHTEYNEEKWGYSGGYVN